MKVNGNIEFYTLGQGEIQNAIIERMTTTERNAASHVDGRVVFDTDTGMYYYSYSGTWHEITTSDSFTIGDGTNTDSVTLEETLVFSASDGLVTTVTDNNVEISLSNNPTITLEGAVIGSGTITDLGDVTITTTVDHNHDSTYVNLSGDTMTGILTLSADPSNPLEAATKQYVDSVASSQNELNEMNDVSASNAETSNNLGEYMLVNSGTSGDWTDQQHTVGNIYDVTLGTPSAMDVLYYNGSDWVNQQLASTDVSDFVEAAQDAIDTAITNGTQSGISVTYDDGADAFNFDVNDPVVSLSGDITGSATMTDLTDIDIVASVNHTLNTITNVDTTTNAGPNDGDFLRYDNASSTWLNVVPESADISDFTEAVQDTMDPALTGGQQTGITVSYDDNNNQFDFDINDLTVDITGAVLGQASTTNLGTVTVNTTVNHNHDSSYVNVTGDTMTGTLTLNADPVNLLEAATKQYVDAEVANYDALNELNDTNFDGPASGNVVYYDGASWVDQTLVASDLSDVNTTGVSDRHLLGYDSGAGEWSVQYERYDITFGYGGQPSASEYVHLFAVPQLGTESIRLADPTTSASAQAVTAPSGSDVIIDVYQNGTTLLTTATFAVSSTSATFSNTATFGYTLAANDLITFEINQADSGAAFSDFTISLVGELV